MPPNVGRDRLKLICALQLHSRATCTIVYPNVSLLLFPSIGESVRLHCLILHCQAGIQCGILSGLPVLTPTVGRRVCPVGASAYRRHVTHSLRFSSRDVCPSSPALVLVCDRDVMDAAAETVVAYCERLPEDERTVYLRADCAKVQWPCVSCTASGGRYSSCLRVCVFACLRGSQRRTTSN